VLLRDPLNPEPPEEPQVNTLPSGSVIVTMVLLKLDWIYALPRGTFLRSRLRTRAAAAVRAFLRSAMRYASRTAMSVWSAASRRCLALRRSAIYFFALAFLRPATVLRGPLRVRALVRVRCP
jgi:hypothetical protein